MKLIRYLIIVCQVDGLVLEQWLAKGRGKACEISQMAILVLDSLRQLHHQLRHTSRSHRSSTD